MGVGDFISLQIHTQLYLLVCIIYKINLEIHMEGESGSNMGNRVEIYLATWFWCRGFKGVTLKLDLGMSVGSATKMLHDFGPIFQISEFVSSPE